MRFESGYTKDGWLARSTQGNLASSLLICGEMNILTIHRLKALTANGESCLGGRAMIENRRRDRRSLCNLFRNRVAIVGADFAIAYLKALLFGLSEDGMQIGLPHVLQ